MSRVSNLLAGVGIAALILLFVAILFPWKSVAKRITYEISSASGSQIELGDLSPAFTTRGPVLSATDVLIEHPALDRLRIRTLEIAPRFSTSWLSGEPTLRVWADSELAQVDGLLRLGESSSFVGSVDRVAVEKLPLRLDASGLALSGLMAAEADMALAPSGQLTGSVDFESDSLILQSQLLPLPIPFTRATGRVQVLETGATLIESADFDGPLVKGQLSGEIGMVHRSLSPPIDLNAKLQVLEISLRQMAPSAGLILSESGEADIHLGGTVDSPEVTTGRSATARRAASRSPR